MQKSKKSILIFCIILGILLIVAFTFIIKGKNKQKIDRVINMYNKITSNQNFTFSMQEINSEYKYKISISQRGTDINIDMQSNNEHTSTLILDGHAYFILHNVEEYYEYNSDDIDGDIIISGLKEAEKKEYISGNEEINGKKYYYEEYEGISTFLILLDEREGATVKTRFYFDENDIAYIKNTVIYEQENQEELLKTTLRYEIDDTIFEIPKEYAEL